MAIIKAGKSGKSLARAIRYAARDAETEKRPELASGVNCADSAKEAIEAMGDTKNFYQKTGGRQYKSYIQSFSKEEKILAELAQEIGIKWAEKNFGEAGYECFVGTHVNSKSGVVHNHIIVNSVNFTNGQKIQLSKAMLEKMKDSNDEICLENGLSTIDRSENAVVRRGRLQAWDNDKYTLLNKKDSSWMVSAANALQAAMRYTPRTPQIFIERMARQGWQVKFRGQKHITLVNAKNPNEKVRVDTLAKTFGETGWTRSAIEKGFAQQSRQAGKTFAQPQGVPIRQPKTATKIRPPSSLTQKLNSEVGSKLIAKLEEDESKKRLEWTAMSKLDREIELERE